MALVNKKERIKYKRPLKRSLLGLEIELMTLDHKGSVTSQADALIKAVKKSDPEIPIVKECAKNMVELRCYPDIEASISALELLEGLQTANRVAEQKDMHLYFMGTYPGKFTPKLRNDPTYHVKKQIFGKERFEIAGRCIGFHHHYTLPKGVFDHQKKEIRLMINSKLKRSMLNSYNFEIAVDPALTLLMQSSPFYQGVHLGKDSRVIVYRGGKKLKYMQGLYAKLQQMGGLQPYKQTGADLIHTVNKKIQRWKREIRRVNKEVDITKLYETDLDISWNPVKINKHGTLEQRGIDMNYPSKVVAASVILAFCLKKIQSEFIEVIPTDIGLEEPFKLEDNILHIPPHSYVRNHLQYQGAWHGFENKEVAHYTKRFFKFAKDATSKNYYKIIRPLIDTITDEKSMSDIILRKAKRLGWSNGVINKKIASELVLKIAGSLDKDLSLTINQLRKI